MDVHAFNLQFALVLIYIFMMSNEVETTFHVFWLFGYPLLWALIQIFCFFYLDGYLFFYYWFVESGQPFIVFNLLVENFV